MYYAIETRPVFRKPTIEQRHLLAFYTRKRRDEYVANESTTVEPIDSKSARALRLHGESRPVKHPNGYVYIRREVL